MSIIGIFFILLVPLLLTHAINVIYAQVDNTLDNFAFISKTNREPNESLLSELSNKTNILYGKGGQLASKNFTVYSNTTNQFSIEYPKSWYYKIFGNTVWFNPNASDDSLNYISVTLIPIRNITTTTELEDFISQDINLVRSEAFKGIYNNFTLNEFQSLTISNRSAYKIGYELDNLKFLIYYVKSGDKVYYLTYEQSALSYNQYLPVFEAMIKTLRIYHNESRGIEIPGISVSGSPQGMDINHNTNELYVADQGSNLVSVIDLESGKVVHNITVMSKPYDVRVNSVDNSVYVSNSGSNTLSIIDGITYSVVSEIDTKRTPTDLAVDSNENDKLIFVSDRDDNAVSVISAKSNERISDIFVGKYPTSLAINPLLNRLYVLNTGNNSLSVVDYTVFGNFFKSTEAEIGIGDYPIDLALDSIRNRLYVINQISNNLVILDATSLENILTMSINSPSRIDIDENRNQLFVTSDSLSTMTIIDGNNSQILKTVTLDDRPNFVKSDERNNFVYISNDLKNKIYVLTMDGDITTKVNFRINPLGAGHLKCGQGELADVDNNEYRTYTYNTILECQAENAADHSFTSWYFSPTVSNDTLDDNPTRNFTISDYSTITANFKDTSLQQLLNSEVRNILAAVIAAPFIGFFIPYLLEKRERKTQSKHLKAYMSLIDTILEESTNLSTLLELLEQKRKDIKELVKEGILRESTYELLLNHISQATDYAVKKFRQENR